MGLMSVPNLRGGIAPPRSVGAGTSPGQSRLVEYVDPATGLGTGDTRIEMWLFNNAGIPTVRGDAYQAMFVSTVAKNPQVIVCATTTPLRNVVVAVGVVADQTFGWFAVSGWVDASLEATTDIAAADFLKMTTGTSALAMIRLGTAELDAACAIAVAAITTDGVNRPSVTVPNKVYLLGRPSTIA